MNRKPQPIDVSNLPDLLRLAREVQTSQEPRVLRQGSEDLALLVPVEPVQNPPRPRTRTPKRARGLGLDDPLWDLVGIGRSGQSDVSSNKHRYLAYAYQATAKTE